MEEPLAQAVEGGCWNLAEWAGGRCISDKLCTQAWFRRDEDEHGAASLPASTWPQVPPTLLPFCIMDVILGWTTSWSPLLPPGLPGGSLFLPEPIEVPGPQCEGVGGISLPRQEWWWCCM